MARAVTARPARRPGAPPKFPRCDCGKVWSPTETAARATFELVAGLHPEADPEPVKFYACRFGAWHWTRRGARPPGGP